MRFYCADRAGHAYVESKIESESESACVVQCAVISMPLSANFSVWSEIAQALPF
jgi:hypothetical protein